MLQKSKDCHIEVIIISLQEVIKRPIKGCICDLIIVGGTFLHLPVSLCHCFILSPLSYDVEYTGI